MGDCYHRETTASGKCADCGADQHGRNSHVVAAFRAGNVTVDRNGNTREPRDRIQSGNGNLASVRAGTGRNDLGNGQHAPVTFLQSYGVTIAIRRDSDGAIFLNGHSYSPSTGRHQREAGASWRDGLSFPALASLLGPTWYETANVVETAKGAHELTGDGERYGPTYTLLETVDPLNPTGAHAGIICGFERGRANGRTDQLWAAICPRMVSNVVDALASLNPFGAGAADVKRQGDLFFAPFAGECPCHCHVSRFEPVNADGVGWPDAEARNADVDAELRRYGLLTKAGTIRKGHGCTRAGENAAQLCKRRDSPPADALRLDGLELPDAGGRHVATRSAITARNARFAQGQIIHPEHRTLMLKTWHRVGRSLATRAMSAAYRQGWTGGRGYYAD